MPFVLRRVRSVAALALEVVCVFYLKGWRLSATLLLVSTTGDSLLTAVLKAVFGRARPELFDSGHTASFYSYPSGHATVAASVALLVFLVGFSRL